MTPKHYTDLFIDFDDTLYDTRGNAVIALSELFDHFHLQRHFPDSNIFFDAYWKTNVELWAQYAKGEITRPFLILERFRRPLSLGIPDVSEEFCLKVSDVFLELCSDKPGTVDGAHELMDYLKGKRYRMHLCSNGFHEVQYRKLRACRLLSYFDSIILSEDAGSNKPTRAFFNYAFRESGANPQSTIMIGDNYVTDIEGAMDAGIDTLFFNRWDSSFKPSRPANHEVTTLRQIINIL